MASPRITGSWLDAPPAGSDLHDYRGQSLGLPPTGPGSVVGLGPRFVAFAIDAVLSWLVATIPAGSVHTGIWSTLVFLVEYAVLVGLGGQSAGMRLTGLRVVSVTKRPTGHPGIGWWAVPRAVLLGLIVPVLFTDRDGRGLHDRATGTAVVRA